MIDNECNAMWYVMNAMQFDKYNLINAMWSTQYDNCNAINTMC